MALTLLPAVPANAQPLTGNGYDSQYAGESAFSATPAGGTAQLTAIFFNSGARTWDPGRVGLLVCGAPRVGCGHSSSSSPAYAHGWYSSSVYATIARTVAPGDNGFFTYEIDVPPGTPAGTIARFDGEVGLIETGVAIHPEGYYHQNIVPGAASALVATFASQPIVADEGAPSMLTVDVLGPSGQPATDDATTIITATREGSAEVCSISGAATASATVAGGRATFLVISVGQPGLCHVTIAASPVGLRTAATLETRQPGIATRLTVSGTSSPQAADGVPISIGVDIDDVNVALVGSDQTSMVHLSLDGPTCAGGPGGDVYVPSGFDVPARDGRAWFVLRSGSSYAACRASVTSPGLIGSTFVVTFTPPK